MRIHRGGVGMEADRRRHPRFAMPAMYTAVAARRLDDEAFDLFGHAYDVSEGGMRFEVDEALEPGSGVAVRLHLPGYGMSWAGRRAVYAFANVVWVEEEDLEYRAGPVRMACVFTRFVQRGDLERLRASLESGRYSLAA